MGIKIDCTKLGRLSMWAEVSIEGWKWHVCPVNLVDGLVSDGANRGHEFVIAEMADSAFIDQPGMCMVDRKIEELELDGLKIEIPSEDFESFYDELKSARERTFDDGNKYHKIHGWRCCIVLSPEQRAKMLSKMEDTMKTDVKARADADRKEFSRRLASINNDGIRVLSHKDPDCMKKGMEELQQKAPLSGMPNGDVN